MPYVIEKKGSYADINNYVVGHDEFGMVDKNENIKEYSQHESYNGKLWKKQWKCWKLECKCLEYNHK